MDDEPLPLDPALAPLESLLAAVAAARPEAFRDADLAELSPLPPAELAARCALPPPDAYRLAAAFELGRRRALGARPMRPALDSPAAVFAYAAPAARDLRIEVFRVLVVDARNRLVHDEAVSQGVLTASLVHPREVLRPVVVRSGAAFVVVHNHPSGDPAPSREDDRVTERLRRAGEILGAALLDHVVLGDGTYWSYRERGLLAGPVLGTDALAAEESPLPEHAR
jgi:DNA repair protein RadC